ncbi:MAG: adenylosuccinate lyase, partial [bacterium]
MVYPQNMKKNLEKTHGLVFSQSLLLALTRKGITREDAYQLVQKRAMEVWNSGEDFKALISSDDQIREWLTEEEIEKCFDLNTNLRNVDFIFKRVGLNN